MKLLKPTSDVRYVAQARQVEKLQADRVRIEAEVKSLRLRRDNPHTVDERAEALAAGREIEGPDLSLDDQIVAALDRLDLTEKAVAIATRRLAEIRESVGHEFAEQQTDQYHPVIERVGNAVAALAKALGDHEQFCAAWIEAGLPLTGNCPLGGYPRGAGYVLADFGSDTTDVRTFCGEFFHLARQHGYCLEKQKGVKSNAVNA